VHTGDTAIRNHGHRKSASEGQLSKEEKYNVSTGKVSIAS
jgi:hypothetical protein